MDNEFTYEQLPQAARALEFIRVQLSDLVTNCGAMLRRNIINRDVFEAAQDSLEKVLHEVRAACRPPPVKPQRSDFKHIKTIGKGGFGVVDLVRHKKTQKLFAMKQIKLKKAAQRWDVLLERDILAYLEFPRIASMFCSFETERFLYMVMEYIGGGDVGTLLRYNRRFSVETARFYTAELVLALEYLHDYGIIHRDLKPDNLLITTSGHIKVTDFGLAKFWSQKITCWTEEDCRRVAKEFTDGEICGTPGYIAPETYMRTGYGKPVDWWATGVILYKYVYGFTPFSYAPVYKLKDHVISDEVPWPDAGYKLPVEVRSLMCELLNKDCIRRLGTKGADEVKQHWFFKDVDWKYLDELEALYVPQLKNEEDTTCFGECTNVPSNSADDGQGKPSAAADDFCYVAFRFNQEYGSPLPLRRCTDMDEEQEEQEMRVHDEGFVEADLGPSSTHHQAVPVSVDPVGESQGSDLLMASAILGDVEIRLVELARDCDSQLLNGLTSLDWFVELKQRLEEILCQVDPSAPPHHASPLPAGQHQGMDLLEATWILKCIKFQLLDLADECGILLQNGQVGPSYFALLKIKLENVLHEVDEVDKEDTIKGGSSVDNPKVKFEEDASGDDDEPEGRTCQSFNPLEAASTLGSIEVQLVELAEGICNVLENTRVSPNYFVELRQHLKEILHKMDSHCDPALPSPADHAPPDKGPRAKPTVSVDPVGESQGSDLLMASAILGDVEIRLVELARDCDSQLLNGLTSLDWFVELKQRLEEILCQVDPSAPPHHASPLPAGQHQGMDLLEATWILKCIKFQLLDLANECGIWLQNGQVGPSYFALLKIKLENVLHEVDEVDKEDTIKGGSSVDNPKVKFEEDASGDDDEPEGRTCQSFNPLEAASTLGSIEVQLVELAEGICNVLENTPVSPNYFVELRQHLKEILHKMDSHCDPALPSPADHAPPDKGPRAKPAYVLKTVEFKLRTMAQECKIRLKHLRVTHEYCVELRTKLEGILHQVATLR